MTNWSALREAWLAATGADEADVGEGAHDAGGGWILRAIGSNAKPGYLRSRFAIHEATAFAYEERTVGDTFTVHVTSAGEPDPAAIADARAKLHGDPRGRRGKMPAAWEYIVEYRRMSAATRRAIRPKDMADRYKVDPNTERRFRKQYHIPWPPDLYGAWTPTK